MDIFIVNPNNLDAAHLGQVLNARLYNNSADDDFDDDGNIKFRMLLFEDFDRFLESKKTSELMSQILNALDGITDKGNVVRFFTGNNCDIIFKNSALINRMHSKMEFKAPTRDMFKEKLDRLLTYYDLEALAEINSLPEFGKSVSLTKQCKLDRSRIDEYLDLIVQRNVTLRPFTTYCIRYLFRDDCIRHMIENISDIGVVTLSSSIDKKEDENEANKNEPKEEKDLSNSIDSTSKPSDTSSNLESDDEKLPPLEDADEDSSREDLCDECGCCAMD
jgi:SpoVK/Ycf46/Vps4 family AAA+-type ATPase